MYIVGDRLPLVLSCLSMCIVGDRLWHAAPGRWLPLQRPSKQAVCPTTGSQLDVRSTAHLCGLVTGISRFSGRKTLYQECPCRRSKFYTNCEAGQEQTLLEYKFMHPVNETKCFMLTLQREVSDIHVCNFMQKDMVLLQHQCIWLQSEIWGMSLVVSFIAKCVLGHVTCGFCHCKVCFGGCHNKNVCNVYCPQN